MKRTIQNFLTGKPTWHGNDDHHTSPHSFWTGPELNPMHVDAFKAVIARLLDLEATGAVQFLFHNPNSSEGHFVAYRFTSDEAYNRYYTDVHVAGRGLGRGCFEPFYTSSNQDCERFVFEAKEPKQISAQAEKEAVN